MAYNFNLFVVSAGITTIFTIFVLVYGIFNYSLRKYSLPFIIFSFFALLTSASSFAILGIVEYTVALKWSYLFFVGLVFSPIALLILVIDFIVSKFSRIKPYYKYLLYLIPASLSILFLNSGIDIVDSRFGYMFDPQTIGNLIIPLYLTAINLLIIGILGFEIHIRKKLEKSISSVRLLLVGMILYVLGQFLYQALYMAGLAIRIPSTAISQLILFIFIFISLIRIEISVQQLSLSQVVDNIKDCIILTDNNGDIVRINKCIKESLFSKESKDTLDEISQERVKNQILKTSVNKSNAIEFINYLQNRSTSSFHKDIEIKTFGNDSTFDISASTILDKNNKSLGKLSIFRDITQRTRLEDRLKKSEEALSIKNRISNIFLTVSDEKMYEKVLEIILNITKSRYGFFGYIDRRNILVCPSLTRDVWDICRVKGKRIEFPHKIWKGIWGKTLAEKKSFYYDKPFKLPKGHVQLKNAVAVPIVYREKSIGILMIGEKASNYTKKDIKTLEEIAGFIAPVLKSRLQIEFEEIKRKKYELKVKYLSFHDSLTGLYNRRYFEEELKRLDTSRQLPLSIIMADIDGLKLVNDKYGHKIGDKLIIAASKVLNNSSRKEDIVARWGGDEFVILLPATTEIITMEIIERINSSFNRSRLNDKILISVSIGFATKNDASQEIKTIMDLADKNMYKDKIMKKDKVSIKKY